LAIDTYCHVAAIERPDGLTVASYSRMERVGTAREIENDLVREAALLHGWASGFEVHILSEVTSRGSGFGASSAVAVCLSSVFSRMARMRRGEVGEGPVEPIDVARGAWTVEIDRLKRPIGRQDHAASAHGGLRLYRFEGEDVRVERSFSYEDAVWVASHLVVSRLSGERDAGTILSGISDDLPFEAAYAAVPVAVRAIESKRVDLLAEAFRLVHETKERVPGSVTPAVAQARSQFLDVPGVLACTVAGAGGGGHLVAVCDPAVFSIGDRRSLSTFRVRPDILGARSEGWQ
jgi:D-glycero-alpha-D-manno-heptose-7-phosphate kinase